MKYIYLRIWRSLATAHCSGKTKGKWVSMKTVHCSTKGKWVSMKTVHCSGKGKWVSMKMKMEDEGRGEL